MNKTIGIIIDSTIKWSLRTIFGLLALLLAAIYYDLVPIVLPVTIQKLPQALLLKILAMAIIVCADLIVLSFMIYLHLKIKLKPKLGALWDKNKEPYCTIHKTPLARHIVKFGGKKETGLRCNKCGKTIQLINAGRRLTLEDAQKLL